jgi:uncharacterized Zn-finger protein
MANSTAQAQNKTDENVIVTTDHRVACDGGGTHPLTYYDLGKTGHATCHYCGQKFAAKH